MHKLKTKQASTADSFTVAVELVIKGKSAWNEFSNLHPDFELLSKPTVG